MKRLGLEDFSGASMKIGEAASLSPFEAGLEYGAPARGVWNIVHIGMNLPESHQIFVCSYGCLRGVVLTASEMGASDRFSTISVCENNVIDGDMEQYIIEGTSDILSKLPKHPRAMLIFTACIHQFMGCDLKYIFKELSERFPDVDFMDCYMTPISRKKITPDAKMRAQLYSLLRKDRISGRKVNIIGNNYPVFEGSELLKILKGARLEVKDICCCKTYDEYLSMAESFMNIYQNPAAALAAEELEKRLGQQTVYIPLSYGRDEIMTEYKRLADALGISVPDIAQECEEAEVELIRAASLLKDTPIAIDYTATTRPLGLARLLTEYGMNVVNVYADAFHPEERADFEWLKEQKSEMLITATIHPKMRVYPRVAGRIAKLAIGQKAAYFENTENFVNVLEGGGLYGFGGIAELARLIRDAAEHKKDMRNIIQVKGWGCCC